VSSRTARAIQRNPVSKNQNNNNNNNNNNKNKKKKKKKEEEEEEAREGGAERQGELGAMTHRLHFFKTEIETGCYTMEYYSAIKKNEFMKFLAKWMDLEGIILSEVTQSQRNSHNMYSLISGY
jgi:anti-sigma28 factor (negative regulator of flagellin synthesis)